MQNITLDNLRGHQQSHEKWNSWWEHDAKEIPLCRVCDECRSVALNRCAPEVLGLCGRYEDVVEEQIEEDY